MEEYPDLDDNFLEQLSSKKAKPDRIHDRSLSLVGKAMGWLFDRFIFNTSLFDEETITRMIAKGQSVYDEYNRKFWEIDRAIVRAVTENNVAILDEAKRVSGLCNMNWFNAEVGRMNAFCELYSGTVEQHCMFLSLPARSGIALAAYFYQPALKWGLFKAIFKKR